MTAHDILIHPGFHKTGTTFLQSRVFANETVFHRPWNRELVREVVMEPHELAFDRERASKTLMPLCGEPDGRITVLSEEGLSGNPFNGARESAVLARKLSGLFAGAQIFITIRRQEPLLRSVYIQYLKEGGRQRPAEFFAAHRYPEFPAFNPEAFRFHRLAGYYADLFGAAKVLVLPQEYLRGDQAGFLGQLAGFLGRERIELVPAEGRASANVSPSVDNAAIFRFGNRFMKGPFNETGSSAAGLSAAGIFRSLAYRLAPMSQREGRELDRVLKGFGGFYTESNRSLQQYCPVDLGEFGYF